jgi:uncharacterized phage-associated protein
MATRRGKKQRVSFKKVKGGSWNLLDVAAFIVQVHEEVTGNPQITSIKLHRLLYYVQAASFVWDGRPLFDESIQAWANGPVVPAIYRLHNGSFKLTEPWPEEGQPDRLDKDAIGVIDGVVRWYGRMSTYELSKRVQSQKPWLDARSRGQRCEEIITTDAILEFHRSVGFE